MEGAQPVVLLLIAHPLILLFALPPHSWFCASVSSSAVLAAAIATALCLALRCYLPPSGVFFLSSPRTFSRTQHLLLNLPSPLHPWKFPLYFGVTERYTALAVGFSSSPSSPPPPQHSFCFFCLSWCCQSSASSPVRGATSEHPLRTGWGECWGRGVGETKTVPGRLMRPGGSSVLSVISIQPRCPLLPLPIISQSFGSATSRLRLCEGHAAREPRANSRKILMEKLRDHMITPPSLISSNVKHCLFVSSLVSATRYLSLLAHPPSPL